MSSQELFDKVPTGLKSNVTGWLVYDETQELPAPKLITNYYAFDDFALVPHDRQEIYEDVDYSLTLNFRMGNLGDGAN
jgi:iron transport multicopper oxidase